MKNTIKLGLLLLCISTSNIDLLAQCANTINTQSTDWRNYPTTSNNDWDWTQAGSTYPAYLDNNLSNPSMYIELPYFCTKLPGTGSCDGFHNVESYKFKGNSKQFQDINPEDGWELLKVDFGALSNFNTSWDVNPQNYPGLNPNLGKLIITYSLQALQQVFTLLIS